MPSNSTPGPAQFIDDRRQVAYSETSNRAGAALVAGAAVLPEHSAPDAHRVGIPGFVAGMVALGALVFAVINAETADFATPHVTALLCVSVLAGAVFLRWEKRTRTRCSTCVTCGCRVFLTVSVVAQKGLG